MKAATRHRWTSTRSSTQFALDIPARISGRQKLVEPGPSKARPVAVFVVAHVERGEPGHVRSIIEMSARLHPGSRLCLALDATTFTHGDIGIDRDRAGVLLDNVDAATPLAMIADEFVEAIRFEPSFAARAMEHLRTSCIMAAMLGLARDLGVCTLGPRLTAKSNLMFPDPVFDYVPDEGTRPSLQARNFN